MICAGLLDFCGRIGMLKGACVAIDGCSLKGAGSRDRKFIKRKIASRMTHLEADVQRDIDEKVRIERQESGEARATRVTNRDTRYERIR